jgi:hypothetical protein
LSVSACRIAGKSSAVIASFVSKSSAPLSRSARRRVRMARALSKTFATISRTKIDLAQSGFGSHGLVERLPRGLIGALSEGLDHTIERHHFGGDLGGALEIVGRAGRNVAFEEENFGGAPSH